MRSAASAALSGDDEGARMLDARAFEEFAPAGVAEIDHVSGLALLGDQRPVSVEGDQRHVLAVEHARDGLPDAAEAADHHVIAQARRPLRRRYRAS